MSVGGLVDPLAPEVSAAVLAESIGYISRFRGKRIVVKAGGSALVDPNMAADFVGDVFLMHAVGMEPLVVHGGGPQITAMLTRLGVSAEFKHGHRVTDASSLDIIRMIFGWQGEP